MTVLTPENVRSFAGLRVIKAQEIPVSRGLCLALCSPGGAGKTTTAATICKSKEAGKVVVFDIDASTDSIAHLPVDVVQIEKWPDMQAIGREYERLKPGDEYPWDTLIWDNLTEAQNRNISSIVPAGDIQIQHWGKSTADILRFTRFWRDQARRLGINVIFNVWEEQERDEASGRYRRHVSFTNKLAAQWPGIVTMIGHISAVDRQPDKRRLSFTLNRDTDAKWRVAPTDPAAKIPTEMIYGVDDPVLGDLLDAVRNAKPFPIAKYSPPQKGVQ